MLGIGKNIYYILIMFKLMKSEVIVIINVLVEFKDYVCVCGFIVVIGWVFVFGKVVGIMYGLFLGFGFLG